jgi:hypothetical protein
MLNNKNIQRILVTKKKKRKKKDSVYSDYLKTRASEGVIVGLLK